MCDASVILAKLRQMRTSLPASALADLLVVALGGRGAGVWRSTLGRRLGTLGIVSGVLLVVVVQSSLSS